ncbi:hypothetical protein HYH02_002630 [Chlamydomonas schloesseri]|uniref:Uncharacterized protein n=1 Tax=Chlamydomonas schloesseri TaxID=2026947 RepID=A0A835WQT0_9CHLO|nr:hypothetical protein HYH02_002630 [Chlamydomonas schloesseri]|eukprot:KAG2452384.1 hypothetical protein HYH02_002630 [Chlamydomonas schloesseri]
MVDVEATGGPRVECAMCATPIELKVDAGYKEEVATTGSGEGGLVPLSRSASFSSLHHNWEDDVAEFLHHDVSRTCRDGCRYHGIPFERVGHKPLLLATVQGTDEDGQAFEWIARRCRKRVKQPYECPLPPPKLLWTDALAFKRHYAKPGWWIAFLFAVGSVFWLFTGIARMTTPISKPEHWPPGLSSLSAGMSVWPEVVALYLMYLPACIIQVYEAINMDLESRLRAWRCACARHETAANARAAVRAAEEGAGSGGGGAKGQQVAAAAEPPPAPAPPRPRPRLLPGRADLRTVSFWLAAMQLIGIFVFCAAVTTELVGKAVLLDDAIYRWVVSFEFFIGGALFTGSSWMACIEETGSYWRGAVPSRWSDLHSVSWAAVFFALHGSLGFMIFGIVFFSYLDIGWASTQGIMFYGQVWASTCFIISSTAGLLEQANPEHL